MSSIRNDVIEIVKQASKPRVPDLSDDSIPLLRLGLVQAESLLARFAEIEPELYRFPAVDAARFRAAVERVGN